MRVRGICGQSRSKPKNATDRGDVLWRESVHHHWWPGRAGRRSLAFEEDQCSPATARKPPIKPPHSVQGGNPAASWIFLREGCFFANDRNLQNGSAKIQLGSIGSHF